MCLVGCSPSPGMSRAGVALAVAAVTFCVPQECRSPSGDIPEPRRSAFEPPGAGQEKLDFNRNLKEGGKGFWGKNLMEGLGFPWGVRGCSLKI